MVFWEKFEQERDLTEGDITSGTKSELHSLKAWIDFQNKGEAEKLPEDQIDNITKFCEEYLDHDDTFVVRARADGFWWSESWAKDKKQEALNIALKLKEKGIVVTPDISTGNTAQAWVRALTLLDQLPISTLALIKNHITFDVQPVSEKDEKWTYRLASFDIQRWTEYIPDIQKWNYEEPVDIDQPFIEESDDNIPYQETILPDVEKNVFSSWEALQKPLSVPLVAKIGKQYYIKYTFYKWENWKLFTASRGWQKTSKERFNERISKKGLKANSISLNLTDELSKYEKELSKLPKLGKRLSYLNNLSDWNPKYALNKLYQNQHQRKWSEKYIARAKENEVQNLQKLYASN